MVVRLPGLGLFDLMTDAYFGYPVLARALFGTAICRSSCNPLISRTIKKFAASYSLAQFR